MNAFPYDEFDYLTQPTPKQIAEAGHFKVKKWSAIQGKENIQRCLADGDGVIIGIEVFSDLKNISPSNSIYDVVTGDPYGSHTVCLIGYDDEKNAYKFINSWGTDWGIDGYCWISYDLVDNKNINCHGASVGFTMEMQDTVYSEKFFDYTVSNDEAIITNYFGIDEDVIIPDTLGEYPVTDIGDRAFIHCDSIDNVIISDNIKTIGSSAFEDCASLKSVIIGDGVTTISTGAFKNDISLNNVLIGNSLSILDGNVFSGCTKLKYFLVSSENTFLTNMMGFYLIKK